MNSNLFLENSLCVRIRMLIIVNLKCYACCIEFWRKPNVSRVNAISETITNEDIMNDNYSNIDSTYIKLICIL
ncbi:MAG: hypothetical protein M2R45_03087 [Verrucomicrobia subdivision 3 bacterium]|nr:hypothetical protein [Limisphaerales bacterium]MCS1416573.1 hypothetical protein [Limisphaerales bacterium]